MGLESQPTSCGTIQISASQPQGKKLLMQNARISASLTLLLRQDSPRQWNTISFRSIFSCKPISEPHANAQQHACLRLCHLHHLLIRHHLSGAIMGAVPN